MEVVLDWFNLTEVAFKHEQIRLVKYLSDDFAPSCFKSAVMACLTLKQNKPYKLDVVPFCTCVTQLMQYFIT